MGLRRNIAEFRFFLGKMRRHSVGIKSLTHFNDWQRSLEKGNSPLNDEVPWITFESLKKLQSIVKPEFLVFEYGGGGSTLFLSKHVKNLTTVEHDDKWFKFVVDKMKALGRTNWTGSILPPEKVNTTNNDYSDPELFLSGDDNYKGMSFEKYAKAIDQFPDESFDLVMVDGRARPSCIKHALPKVQKGGYLVIDNSERDYYLAKIDMKAAGFVKFFNDFGPGPYMSDFWQTTIWQKK